MSFEPSCGAIVVAGSSDAGGANQVAAEARDGAVPVPIGVSPGRGRRVQLADAVRVNDVINVV